MAMTKRASDDPADRGEVIRRDSPTPYHRQLTDILERQILDRVIAEQSRLPSELELAERFGLSRSTVRQALRTLVSRGYAVRIANRGHFASTPPQEHGWMIQDRAGFLENGIGHHNRRVTTQVLSAQQEPFPSHVCHALRLPEGSEGLVLVRRRLLDGAPALIGTNFHPPHVESAISRAADVLRGEASLNAALTREGFVAYGAQRIIHALEAPAEIAELLGVPPGTALVRIRSATWDQSTVPFDYYETWLRTDVVPLEVTTASVASPPEAPHRVG